MTESPKKIKLSLIAGLLLLLGIILFLFAIPNNAERGLCEGFGGNPEFCLIEHGNNPLDTIGGVMIVVGAGIFLSQKLKKK